MARKAGKQRRPERQDQFVVRLPDGMRDQIAAIADQTGRSMNTIIIEALTLHLDSVANDLHETIRELHETVRELSERFEKLESRVRDHDERINPDRYGDLK